MKMSLGIALLFITSCGPSNKSAPIDATPMPPMPDAMAAIDAPPTIPPSDVDVVITADNAYSFGYGALNGIDTFFPGNRAIGAGEIFNCGIGPERYTVPGAAAPSTAYLYIATWDDLAVTQGVLGQFKRTDAEPLYTGDAAFEVCATGINFSDSSVGPSQMQINEQIVICNAGSGDRSLTSAGWVNSLGAVTGNAIGALAIGEANDAQSGVFPLTCPTGTGSATDAQIDTASRWMWYQPGGIATPFNSTGSNTFRSYLIFRLAAKDIPVE